MTPLKLLIYATLLLFITGSCKNKIDPEVRTVNHPVSNEASQKTKIWNPNVHLTKAEFTISGMTCAMGCAAAIQKQLSKIDGVKTAKVYFEKELALVEYDNAKVNEDLIIKTVNKVSKVYQVTGLKMVDTFSKQE